MIAPQFVKPYVKSNKNDAHDAAAICEAATRPHMRFVPIKQIEHQDVQTLHRIRSFEVKTRTGLANQIHGLLLEYGIVVPKGIGNVRNQLATLIDEHSDKLSGKAKIYFLDLKAQFDQVDAKIAEYDQEVHAIAKANPICQRLLKIEGVGPLTATIAWATLTQPELFKNGRGVAAFLGLVPKQYSSGDKTILKGISKRGNRYVRTLLVHGARSVLIVAEKGISKRHRWIRDKMERCGFNKAAVALANKQARIIWAVMHRGEDYQPNHVPEIYKLKLDAQKAQVACA